MNEHETIADVIASMRDEAARADMEQDYSINDAAEMMREFAWRFEAAHKREVREAVTDCNQFSDAAKLREAVVKCVNLITEFGNAEIVETPLDVIVDIEAILKAALAAPPRNCDVYSSDELKVIFKRELVSELPIANEHQKNLVTITAMGVINTLFAPATEKKGENNGR